MPTLQWLDRDKTLKTANAVPYRLLEAMPELGYGDADSRNMLIEGDNLEALKALLPYYAGKVKCIYIDPPYNTQSFLNHHYNDNIQHSDWLSNIYPRLELLSELLSSDGVIVVQIGYDEMAYLKVIMDEIFKRDHCIGQVAVRMSHSAGMKRKAADKRLIKNTEYLLAYYKNEQPLLKPLYEVCDDYPVNYYQYITKLPTAYSPVGEYAPLIDILHAKFPSRFESLNLKKNNKSIHLLFKVFPDVAEFIIQSAELIVRKDSNVPNIGVELSDLKHNEFIFMKADEDYFIGLNSENKPYQIYSLADKLQEVSTIDADGSISKEKRLTNLVGDWWDGFYKDMSRVDVEGGVKFKNSKKPERLIANILELLTNPDDIILDSFLGAGTTAAVAHKMGRCYIGIEMGDHARTHCAARLKKVVDGEQGGISEAVGWQGGGGFRYYKLGEPIFDEAGQINKAIRFEHLAAHIWFAETGTPLKGGKPETPLLGTHNGIAYYLLYNGILGDKRPAGGNVLTSKVWEALPQFDGPKVIYGEATRLGPNRLSELQVTFKQTPYDIKAR